MADQDNSARQILLKFALNLIDEVAEECDSRNMHVTAEKLTSIMEDLSSDPDIIP